MPLLTPLRTPMAVGTFKPIAQLLAKAGVASPLAGGYWRFDMRRYLALVEKETRWDELPGNKVYPARKSLLIASTDVRTSNSAAMYLAVASYVRNGDRVVENAAQGDKLVDEVAPLFLRQGFSAYSTEGPFEDYLTIGVGKTPMVMIYEAQYLARAAAQDGSIGPDRVLMYPEPTVLTKHTLVPLKPAGDPVGQPLPLRRRRPPWPRRAPSWCWCRRRRCPRSARPRAPPSSRSTRRWPGSWRPPPTPSPSRWPAWTCTAPTSPARSGRSPAWATARCARPPPSPTGCWSGRSRPWAPACSTPARRCPSR
jgi:hypothetical protein